MTDKLKDKDEKTQGEMKMTKGNDRISIQRRDCPKQGVGDS